MGIDLTHIKENAEALIEQYALTVPVHVFELADLMGIQWKTCTTKMLERTISKQEPKAKENITDWNDVLGYYDTNSSTIYLNEENHPITRMRFTLAHEIGHKTLHHNLDSLLRAVFFRTDLVTPRDEIETEANYFAAFLLVPDSALKERIKISKLHYGENIVKALAEVFAVSPEMMRIRLKTFQKEYSDIWRHYQLDKKLF